MLYLIKESVYNGIGMGGENMTVGVFTNKTLAEEAISKEKHPQRFSIEEIQENVITEYTF